MLTLAVAGLLAAALFGCGGNGSSTTSGAGTEAATSGETTAAGAETTTAEGGGQKGGEAKKGKSGNGGQKQGGSTQKSGGSGRGGGSSGSGGGSGGSGAGSGSGSGSGSESGSDDFVVPGGDNSVQEFGQEAGASEREQASKVLETYMQARAAEDQKTACASLSKVALAQLQDLATAVPGVDRGDSCVTIFVAIDKRTPPLARANTMTGPIASLRVEGDRAFALYHGTKGVDYTIQMEKEGGGWKVAALVPFAIS